MRKIKDKIIKTPKVLIWDENNMSYIVGDIANCEVNTIYANDMNDYEGKVRSSKKCNVIQITSYNLESKNNIELDKTTMQRIAKYNKNKEIQKLSDIIYEKEQIIIELDNILKDRENRVKALKDFIKNIFELDLDMYNEDYDL